jgi:hypothetical protein
MNSTTSLRGCEEIPWISGTSMLRFAFTNCNETRSWEQVSDIYKSKPEMLTVGGLGTLRTDAFEVWACFSGHDCLQQVVEASYTDAMCYVFDEKFKKWYPWTHASERSKFSCLLTEMMTLTKHALSCCHCSSFGMIWHVLARF